MAHAAREQTHDGRYCGSLHHDLHRMERPFSFHAAIRNKVPLARPHVRTSCHSLDLDVLAQGQSHGAAQTGLVAALTGQSFTSPSRIWHSTRSPCGVSARLRTTTWTDRVTVHALPRVTSSLPCSWLVSAATTTACWPALTSDHLTPAGVFSAVGSHLWAARIIAARAIQNGPSKMANVLPSLGSSGEQRSGFRR